MNLSYNTSTFAFPYILQSCAFLIVVITVKIRSEVGSPPALGVDIEVGFPPGIEVRLEVDTAADTGADIEVEVDY
jgi:hypothetical protein